MSRSAVAALLAGALFATPAASQELDEILTSHYEARGGLEKLKSVETMKATGKMMMGPGMEVPFSLEMKRPNRARLEFTFQGMTGVQAYNQGEGWQIMPFGGRKDPEPMSPEDLKDAAEQADIDGSLVDWKEKGHQVELIGKDTVEGADAWKLKLTLKSGDERMIWLDAEYFLELKSEGKRMVRGSEQEIEMSSGDYKEVDGMMRAFVEEAGPKGSDQRQRFVFDKIEFNVPVDDARFKMPAAEPAPAPEG